MNTRVVNSLCSAMVAGLVLSAVPRTSAAETPSEMFLFEKIPTAIGALVQSESGNYPVAVTNIDEEMIRSAPARNLYDILESYVPGFQYTTHFDASHMGLRGLMVDRDYSFLLLVDGRCVNLRSHDGALTELENWDMNDIEAIQVIRGPGSVTYGPGAVAGVISITTKDNSTSPGAAGGLQYFGGYDSKGVWARTTRHGSKYSLYLYGSCTSTTGYSNPSIYAFAPPSREAGYVGTHNGSNVSEQSPVIDYYPDTRAKPQVKADAELAFLKEWRLLARYVNSGTSRVVCWTDDPLNSDPASRTQWFRQRRAADGSWQNNPSTAVQQASVTLENDHIASYALSVKSTVSALSTDCERIDDRLYGKGNFVENYAETNLLLKTVIRYAPIAPLKMAFGGELSFDHLGMGWGDTDKDAFIMDDGVLFVSRPGSPALAARPWIGTNQQIYRTGYSMHNYALLGEVDGTVHGQCQIMLSGRLDKHEFSKAVLSPRLAVIQDAGRLGTFTLSVQRSIRENTLLQLAATDYFKNMRPSQEVFNGAEVMHHKTFGDLTTDVSVFYSDADLLGWNARGQETDPGQVRTTSKTGNLKVGGVEIAAEYHQEDGKLRVGASYVLSRQLDFSLAPGQAGSYISRSDSHDADYEGVARESIGNDRMNWANQTAKIHAIAGLGDKVTVYGSVRGAWGYAGDKNWMAMYLAGARGTRVEGEVDRNIADMRKNGIFDPDVRVDASVACRVVEPVSITVFGQNVVRLTKNWRYVYIMEGGAAIREETVVGVRADCRF
jgi:outer membrane receptor protein involved in Fe transport